MIGYYIFYCTLREIYWRINSHKGTIKYIIVYHIKVTRCVYFSFNWSLNLMIRFLFADLIKILWLDVNSRSNGNAFSPHSPWSPLCLAGVSQVSYVLYAQVDFPDAALSFTFMFSHCCVFANRLSLPRWLPGAPRSRAKKVSGYSV